MSIAGTMEVVSRPALADSKRGPMVGRSRELQELRERFTRAVDAGPQIVVIGGEAGIGKSRLIAELADTLPTGTGFVVGHCLELGPDGPPFAPFATMLRSLAADLGLEALAELAGPGRTDLAGLLPELGAGQPDPMGRGRLFEAMATVVEHAADHRPLVIVVEDMHWSDSSSRDLLRFLLRTIGDVQVLFLLTYRSDEMHRSHPLRPWLAEVDRLPTAHRVTLERLTDPEVDQLVHQLAGDVPPRAAARIRERSQGVPFFVEELADCCDRDLTVIPETLRDLMLARLDGLSPHTRDLLRMASAAGTQVDHTVLLALVDSDEASVDAALREAVGRQVLVVDRAREAYAFRHALMREAVHADLLPGEHARLHARYAEALETFARPEQAGEIAHHWSAAHEADKAFEWSLRASDHSRSIYAWTEQLAHLERALDLWDRVSSPQERAGFDRAELLSRASRAAAAVGLPDRAVALLDAALAELGPDADPRRVAHLRVKRAMHCEGAQLDPLADLREVQQLAAPGSADLAAALTAEAAMHMLEARPRPALEIAERALVVAEQCDNQRQLSTTHNILGCLLMQLGRGAEGEAHLNRARDLAMAVGGGPDLFRYYGNYSDVLIGSGRYDEAIEMAREGRVASAQRGLARTMGAFLAGNEAEAGVLAGRWDEALAAVDEALRLDPPGATRGHLHTLRAIVQVRRGDVSGAADSADRAGELLTRAVRQPQYMLPLAIARAEVAAADGDPAAALGILGHAADQAGPFVPPSCGWAFVWAWGRLLDEAGASAPPELAAMVAHLAEVTGHPGWIALTTAQAQALAGVPVPDWAPAVAAIDAGDGLAYEEADARLRLAEQLAGEGQLDRARTELLVGWALVLQLGASSLATRAARAAAAARTSLPRPAAGSGRPDAELVLTPREREVLALVAEGRSNRSIADALFISVKTASVHVSNILAKVGASSRTEAAAWAHAHPEQVTTSSGRLPGSPTR